jgi:opacity protein-like surface antigen
MLKYFLPAALLLILVSAVRAQYVQEGSNKEIDELFLREDFLSFAFGISDPVGDYGDVSYENYNAGYALTGYSLHLSYGRLMNKNLGFQIMLSHASNPFDQNTFNNYLNQLYPSLQWTFEATNYYSTALMGGLFLALPMENGFVDMRLLAGYALSQSPELTATVRDSLNTEIITVHSSRSYALAMDIGAGIRYNLTDHFSVSLAVDFYYTKPDFYSTTTSNLGGLEKSHQSVRFAMFNPSIGLAYRLR